MFARVRVCIYTHTPVHSPTPDTAIDLLADRRRGTSTPSPDVRHDARGPCLVHVTSVEVCTLVK